MTLLTLKSYQKAALDALRAFARAAQLKGPALAFGEQVGRLYNPAPFGDVPCICLRIPAGGGKTLMAAHVVNVLAQQWCATATPVAVWLVPREALEASYDTGVPVCVLDYPVQTDLNDGGEEILCAQLLDNHRAFKHWVRKLTTAPCGFALATSKARFYTLLA